MRARYILESEGFRFAWLSNRNSPRLPKAGLRKASMRPCCICQANTPSDGVLIDGSVFQHSCYTRLTKTAESLAHTERALLAELAQPLTVGEKIAMFLFESRGADFLRQKQSLTSSIRRTREEIQTTTAALQKLYDVWLTYPPDWERRRELVNDRDGCCSECGVGNMLQVHHRRPIGEGGTHHIENLVLLCKFCHSDAHGGREFKDRELVNDEPSQTVIRKKVAYINQALTRRRDIQFRYRKPDGAITQRTVTPRELRKLSTSELQKLIGRNVKLEKEGRLCLFGYCHLRQANRTFAISRIYKLSLR
jgi:5-methylcytosine-specific restriction endonuclease McrA